jgi:hypothetical protein
LEGTFLTWFSQIWPLMLVAWRLSERNRCSQNETMTIPAGYSEAMEKVRELASASRVDGWFTVITRTLREWRLTVRDVSTDPSTSA